jgi:hypothetical protein
MGNGFPEGVSTYMPSALENTQGQMAIPANNIVNLSLCAIVEAAQPLSPNSSKTTAVS